MLWSIDSCQNRVSANQYHLTVPRAQVSTHRGQVFFEVIRWQISSYKWSQAQVYFFQWFIWNMVCLCNYGPALLRFWFQTDLGRENSASFFFFFFFNTGEEDLFLPWSRVGHALRPIFMLWLVKIWLVSSCGKFMQHLESCSLWQLKLTEFCVNLWCFLTFFFQVHNKIQLLSRVFCHSWLLCLLVFGWEMRRLSKFGNPISDGIVFVFHLA